jgi:hypothetical protein
MKKYFLCILPLPLLLGCSAGTVASSTTPTIQPAVVNPSVALTSSYQSKGEMFEITFNICNPKCQNNITAVTWGRPTQVGLLYYSGILEEHKLWLKPMTKMPTSSKDQRDLRIQLVFKSSGAVPPLSDPLPDQKFAPVFGPTNLILTSELQLPRKLEVISIRRMTLEEEESKANRARAMPRGIARAGESFETYSLSVWNYYQAIKGKPDDLKPQQVENITWQDGQPPQIIPVKAW